MDLLDENTAVVAVDNYTVEVLGVAADMDIVAVGIVADTVVLVVGCVVVVVVVVLLLLLALVLQ